MKKQIQTNEEKYVKMNEPSLKEARKRRGEELNINIFNLDPKYLNLGVTKKYMLKTYGCQGNLERSLPLVYGTIQYVQNSSQPYIMLTHAFLG